MPTLQAVQLAAHSGEDTQQVQQAVRPGQALLLSCSSAQLVLCPLQVNTAVSCSRDDIASGILKIKMLLKDCPSPSTSMVNALISRAHCAHPVHAEVCAQLGERRGTQCSARK